MNTKSWGQASAVKCICLLVEEYTSITLDMEHVVKDKDQRRPIITQPYSLKALRRRHGGQEGGGDETPQ